MTFFQTQNYYLGFQKTNFNGDKCILLVFSKLNTNFQSQTLLKKIGVPQNFNFAKLNKISQLVEKLKKSDDLFFNPVSESKKQGKNVPK